MKKIKNIVVAIGTRPETIKMAPLIKELKKRAVFSVFVCHSGQHQTLSDDAADFFEIKVDENLQIHKKTHDLATMTSSAVMAYTDYLLRTHADALIVHGDTTTAFSAALAAFYLKIPVFHVEAGLRSYNMYSPYPEEWNRIAIDEISSVCFAPTEKAKKNLVRAGKAVASIYVVGNTVTDALRYTVAEKYVSPYIKDDSRLVIFTAHRRENIGTKMAEMCIALKKLALEYPCVTFLCPVHPNPAVRTVLLPILSDVENVIVTEPLSVYDFHNLLARSYMIMSDSGGVQEEAATLGIPTLVMRTTTERQEGCDSGVIRLVGADFSSVYKNAKALLDDISLHDRMSACSYSYGDGRVSEKICDVIESIN